MIYLEEEIVDDPQFIEAEVLLRTGRRGTRALCIGVYVMAIAYARKHKTDGLVPVSVLNSYGNRTTLAALVAAKLIDLRPDGYYINAYLKHNRSKAQIEHHQEVTRKRLQRWRAEQPEPPRGGNGHETPLLDVSEADVTPSTYHVPPPRTTGTSNNRYDGEVRPSSQDRASSNVQNSGFAAIAPPAADHWKGQRGREPAADGGWKSTVKLAHVVMDETGIDNPDDPDLADVLKNRLGKEGINYKHDPTMPRRALAAAAGQRLITAGASRTRGPSSLTGFVNELRGAPTPEAMGQRLASMAGRVRR